MTQTHKENPIGDTVNLFGDNSMLSNLTEKIHYSPRIKSGMLAEIAKMERLVKKGEWCSNNIKSRVVCGATSGSTLKQEVDQFPEDWDLIPIHDKSPQNYGGGWQKKAPLPRAELKKLLDDEVRFNGVGARSGEIGNGLMPLDYDGYEAVEWMELNKPVELATTVRITSGREYHWQDFYRVPQILWKYAKSTTRSKLNFRWNDCQSAVAGRHPSGSRYRFVEGRGFSDVSVAQIPLELFALVYPEARDICVVMSCLGTIPVSALDSDQWQRVMMAVASVILKTGDDDLESPWDEWNSNDPDRYDPDKNHDRLHSFKRETGVGLGTLINIAKEFGWKHHFPESKDVQDEAPEDNPIKIGWLMSEVGKILDSDAMPSEKKIALNKLAKNNQWCGETAKGLTALYTADLIAKESMEAIPKDILDILSEPEELGIFIVDELCPMGCVVLVRGDSGAGKTLLINDLAFHVANGTAWNDLDVVPGNILLVQTDEPKVAYKHRLGKRGFGKLPKGKASLLNNWQATQIARLKQHLEQFKPRYVLIDCLKSVNTTGEVNENDSEIANCLYKLNKLAEEFECCILVVHHNNKDGKSRGSSAIDAAVREIWHVKKTTNPVLKTLVIEKTAFGETREYGLELDVETFQYKLSGRMSTTVEGEEVVKSFDEKMQDYIEEILSSNAGVLFDIDGIIKFVQERFNKYPIGVNRIKGAVRTLVRENRVTENSGEKNKKTYVFSSD